MGSAGPGPVVGHLAERILDLHGWMALAVVFLLPALESSAFLGFVFPGEIAVLLGGVLAFEHRVPLGAVLAAAIAGAVLGDSVGYAVGRRWGRALLDGTVGRVVNRRHVERAERYVAAKGGKAVFLGRFTAALRVVVPGLSGMAGVSYRSFAVYNVAGGVVWATSFVLLGYAAGTGWRRVEHVAKRASLILLLLLALVAMIVVAARWAAANQDRLRALVSRQLERPPVARIRRRYRAQLDFVSRRLRPEGVLGLSLTVSLLALAAVGWAFGAVVQDVVSGDDAARVDGPTMAFFARHREPWLTTVMKVLTTLGGSTLLVPVLALAGLTWWARRRSWRPLALLAGAYLGAVVLSRVVKVLTHRPRPPLRLAVGHFGGLAFPSGHATQAVAAWGMLAALAAVESPRWGRKVLVWTMAVAVAALVGVTRLYLGAHWLTDVLGGWALGAVWLTVVLVLARTVPSVRGGSRAGQNVSRAGPDRPAPARA